MDITALSTGLASAGVIGEANIQLLDKQFELADALTEGMVKMMESSVTPHLGSNLDISI